jgi:ligand-binding sensor domain-containing protein/signal transduction histidine kinase
MGGKVRTNVIVALVFFILSLCFYAQTQTGNIRFKHLSVVDGLSQEAVNCIIQDRKGFMWFGTQDGLNRYDGYTFKIYKNIPNDNLSLSDKYILCLYEDRGGFLWVGTKNGGLHRYNRDSDNFSNFKDDPTAAAILGDYDVQTIVEGPDGDLWVGTLGGGLLRLDKKTCKFKGYTISNGLIDNNINVIFKGSKGRIWIGTRKGLDCFDRTKENFFHYDTVTAICKESKGILWIGTEGGKLYLFDIDTINLKLKYNAAISSDKDKKKVYNPIRCFFKNKEKILWVGTQKKLIRFNTKNGEFSKYENDSSDSYSLNNNDVRAIYRDKTGIIWLGTYGGGLNIYDPAVHGFKLYNKERNTLSHNTIWAIHVDSKERLWVGTYEGLNLLDKKTWKFVQYLEGEDISCIYEDKDTEILWIGTHKNGFFRFNPENKQPKHYPPEKNGLSDKAVEYILQTRPDEIWLGTFEKGLNKFNPQTEKFTVYRHDKENPNSLSNDKVRVILEDTDGKLWIGTDGGGVNLLVDAAGKGTFKPYKQNKNDLHGLSHNRIKTIYEDRSRRIWIGTEGGGLNLFDKKNGHFKAYGLLTPVPNDTVYGILEDKDGNLWMSTNSGLFKFSLKINSIEKPIIKNYDWQDGLQSNEFDTGAYFKNEKTKKMFFGGARGLNSFLPEDIKDNPHKPTVLLTDFLLFNKSVKIQSKGNDSPLKKTIDETNFLTLTYKQSVMTFEFAALNYANPLKNRYKYKMDGYDMDWLETDAKNRRATYTNLPAGEYTFEVQGSNKDEKWSERTASIKIKILPPPWKTWWAYCLYGMALLGIIFLIVQYQLKKIAKKRQAEAELDRKVKERTQFLEKIDAIVRSINAEMGFTDLLHKILKETTAIKGVQQASALVWDPEIKRYHFKATVGHELEQLEDIIFSGEEAEARYTNGTESIEDDIFIIRNAGERPHTDKVLPYDVLPKSMLIMRICLENKIQAYFVFGNKEHENAFEDQDIQLLQKLKDHVVEAFQKVQLIHRLQEKNKELKETSEQLIQAEKLSSLGTLLAGIAHELFNPAGTIMLNAEWFSKAWRDIAPLLDRYDTEKKLVIANLPYHESREEIEKLISGLMDSSRRIKNLLEELKDFSRKEDGFNKETVDIHRIIQSAVDLTRNLIKKSTDNFSLDFGINIPAFPGNSQRLVQVFINLIRNACEALPDNTRGISLSTEYLKKTDEILIQIKDEGEGIEEGNLSKITDPFFTTRRSTGGIGLGLSISRKIIHDEHQGRMVFTSMPGQGTTVSVHLPVKPFNEKNKQ